MSDHFEELKTCKGCHESKPLGAFGAHKHGLNGKRSRCRGCRAIEAAERNARPEVKARTKESKAAWRAGHKEEHAAYNREWNARNPGAAAATCRRWSIANPEKVKAYSVAYREENQWKRTALQNKRHANKLLRTPAWANLRKIKGWYMAARSQGLQVDHIIPLQGKLVSGSHVHNNLQLLSAFDNISKGNRFEVVAL